MLGAPAPQLRRRPLRPQEQLRLDRSKPVAGNALLQRSGSAKRGGTSRAGGRHVSGRRRSPFDEGLAGDLVWPHASSWGVMPALVVYSRSNAA